jgi:hypothetical protein
VWAPGTYLHRCMHTTCIARYLVMCCRLSSFTSNNASETAAGIAVYDNATLELEGCTMQNNNASSDGGAVLATHNAQVRLGCRRLTQQCGCCIHSRCLRVSEYSNSEWCWRHTLLTAAAVIVNFCRSAFLTAVSATTLLTGVRSPLLVAATAQ